MAEEKKIPRTVIMQMPNGYLMKPANIYGFEFDGLGYWFITKQDPVKFDSRKDTLGNGQNVFTFFEKSFNFLIMNMTSELSGGRNLRMAIDPLEVVNLRIEDQPEGAVLKPNDKVKVAFDFPNDHDGSLNGYTTYGKFLEWSAKIIDVQQKASEEPAQPEKPLGGGGSLGGTGQISYADKAKRGKGDSWAELADDAPTSGYRGR